MAQKSRLLSNKVLVVDDHPTVRMLFNDALTYFGYAVVTAASGEEALILAEAEDPDLIVMDCQMPDMTGLEVAQRLRRNPATREIPVLGVTGGFAAELNELLAAGYTECLLKPISLDRFQAVIARLLPTINREEQVSG